METDSGAVRKHTPACRARGAISDGRLLESCGEADVDTGTTPLESHRRHKKEVADPIPVSNCLKNG